MGAYYDEIEIEDMVWDENKAVYHYPCPCGDRFEISRRQLADCEDIATCPSCSLIIRIIFDPLDFEDEPQEDEEGDSSEDDDSDDEDDDEDERDKKDKDEGGQGSGLDESFEDTLEKLAIEPSRIKSAMSKFGQDTSAYMICERRMLRPYSPLGRNS